MGEFNKQHNIEYRVVDHDVSKIPKRETPLGPVADSWTDEVHYHNAVELRLEEGKIYDAEWEWDIPSAGRYIRRGNVYRRGKVAGDVPPIPTKAVWVRYRDEQTDGDGTTSGKERLTINGDHSESFLVTCWFSKDNQWHNAGLKHRDVKANNDNLEIRFDTDHGYMCFRIFPGR